ncbi:hypothetical protein EYF80_032170 [Liparis tanakae]|uniref:Uncharacterized protein n=1 Tax=Liparis tanakae TaxID=230148 RepID=A0A4Z2GVH9_9TELE|nr:hypothetical protein EYF80_032170 [Liparis tanakae]
MLAASSGVPVTTCTPAGLHSSTALFTKSATAGGSEGTEARERTPTLALTPPCLKERAGPSRQWGHPVKCRHAAPNWLHLEHHSDTERAHRHGSTCACRHKSVWSVQRSQAAGAQRGNNTQLDGAKSGEPAKATAGGQTPPHLWTTFHRRCGSN